MSKLSKNRILITHYSRVIYHNVWYSLFLNICVIYALIGNYFNLIFFTKQADLTFTIVTLIVIFVFFFDFIIYLIGNYINPRWKGLFL